MLSIVVPMAGRGTRFASVGYADPKPLIPLHGIPMIRWVIRNLRISSPHRFIFIAQADHVASYGLREKLAQWAPGSVIEEVDGFTDGAALTVLVARKWIDSEAPILIANSDQWIEFKIDEFAHLVSTGELDGYILTMKSDDPKWSFVSLNNEGRVTRVVEKEVISNEATVGIYGFKKGADFVRAAEAMIDADSRVNGEFYVAPVYNWMIASGAKVGVFNIGEESRGMFGLGTPSDLEAFLSHPSSRITWPS